MRLTSAFTAAVLIGGLTACDLIGPSAVSSTTNNYDPAEYAQAAKASPIPVTVTGSALGMSGPGLTKAVIDNMTGQDWAPHARFAPASDVTQGSVFSFAVMLNGPNGVTGASLCGRQSASASAATSSNAGEVVLVAGLCRYNEAVSNVQVRISGATGPQDPKFASMIATAVRSLTPPIVTNRMNDTNSDMH
jgi:hypothetical protein